MFNCSFSIDEETDAEGQFSVNSYGLITTAKPLDREAQREHRIHVLATDKGKLYDDHLTTPTQFEITVQLKLLVE